MKNLVTLTAAVLTAAAFASPALAADQPGRTVAYGDLNLSSPAGVAAFNRRVAAVAKRMCGDAPGARSLAEEMWIDRCVAATVNDHAREGVAYAARTI